MIKYCPTCPRSTDDIQFIGEFCKQCIINKISKNLPLTINVIICRSCGKVKETTDFVKYDRSSVAKIIRRELHNKFTVSVTNIKNDKIAYSKLTCPVENTGEDITFSKELFLKFSKQTCIKCIRKHSGYYQAIVQLRGNMDRIDVMKDKIDRYLTKRNSFITKRVELHNGEDLYVEDKNKMKAFFDMYREIKPKVSYTLAGMKNGKRLYRHTYYVYLSSK